MPATFPDDTQRLTIIGRTGSGKTQVGLWHLSQRSITSKPWIIVDFKRDRKIAEIPYLKEVDFRNPPPREPGLYVIRPVPENDEEDVDKFLYYIWQYGNTGLFVDEGTMIGKLRSFRAILTQGREKEIPLITLSQRPFDLTTYIWSESEFFQILALQFRRDFQRIAEFSSVTEEQVRQLKPYWSLWYEVGTDQTRLFRPVPDRAKILETFRVRLAPKDETIVEAPSNKRRFTLI